MLWRSRARLHVLGGRGHDPSAAEDKRRTCVVATRAPVLATTHTFVRRSASVAKITSADQTHPHKEKLAFATSGQVRLKDVGRASVTAPTAGDRERPPAPVKAASAPSTGPLPARAASTPTRLGKQEVGDGQAGASCSSTSVSAASASGWAAFCIPWPVRHHAAHPGCGAGSGGRRARKACLRRDERATDDPSGRPRSQDSPATGRPRPRRPRLDALGRLGDGDEAGAKRRVGPACASFGPRQLQSGILTPWRASARDWPGACRRTDH